MEGSNSLEVVGYCDVVSATNIQGWAYDPSEPDDPLVMQVLIDGSPICSVTCDLIRLDVTTAGYVAPRVGFFVAIPRRLQNGRNRQLEFRRHDGKIIALKDRNGPRQSWILPMADVQLGAQPVDQSDEQILAQPDVIVGVLDPVADGDIRGWAYATDAPNVPVVLDVFINDVFQFTVTCDEARPDLVAAGHPNAKVGYRAQVPGQYFDGASHVLEVRPQPDDLRLFQTSLEGRSQVFNFAGLVFQGQVDGLHAGAVKGWVFQHDRRTGGRTGGLQVLVTMQGHPVAQITARQSRADVAAAHGCDRNCGFVFYPPAQLVAGRSVDFDFRVIPGGYVPAGSPVRVAFPSLETVAAIRDLHEATDRAFAELWLLRDRVRRMAPLETYTVGCYDPWARQYQRTLAAAPNQLAGLLPANGSEPPLVSIICPAYRPGLEDFAAAVESVLAQTYPHWELIIVDDASRSPELTTRIAGFKNRDKRIKAVPLKTNLGISGATNVGLSRAKGQYVALFDHDDLLANRAIEFMLAAALRTGAQMVYSDEDKIDEHGLFSEVHFKPDWNYRLLLAINYVCHLVLVERAQIEKAGPFRKEYDGAQDHDILLRLSELIPPDRIVHVPEVLYHWRKSASSTAASGSNKRYAVAAGIRAIEHHLARRGLAGRVHSPREITCYEIDWEIAQQPAVTIIIPYREHVDMTRACLDSIWAKTDYINYKIVLIDNWSTSDQALSFAAEMKERAGVAVIRVEEKFNYSRLNNLAVEDSDGELVLFMNNDVFVSDPKWLHAMVGEMVADPLVGVVGNKLLYPSGQVQHGGVILGIGGVADHAHKGLSGDDPGYVARAICAQQMSAVTAACMLCRRAAFESVGGFDEVELQVAFNDVDLCLKIGQAGYRVIWTPSSVAEHRESLSRGDDMRPDQQTRFFHENETMVRRWGAVLSGDRFYHRAFSRLSGVFTDLATASVGPAPSPAELVGKCRGHHG